MIKEGKKIVYLNYCLKEEKNGQTILKLVSEPIELPKTAKNVKLLYSDPKRKKKGILERFILHLMYDYYEVKHNRKRKCFEINLKTRRKEIYVRKDMRHAYITQKPQYGMIS